MAKHATQSAEYQKVVNNKQTRLAGRGALRWRWEYVKQKKVNHRGRKIVMDERGEKWGKLWAVPIVGTIYCLSPGICQSSATCHAARAPLAWSGPSANAGTHPSSNFWIYFFATLFFLLYHCFRRFHRRALLHPCRLCNHITEAYAGFLTTLNKQRIMTEYWRSI